MVIYVGYVLADYACALCMGTNKKAVESQLKSYPTKNPKWVEEYEIKGDEVVELNCD